jgi:hypothetical protein
MKINGRLQLDIFKTIDGKKVKVGEIDEANLITLSGKQVMAYLMAGEPGNHKISKFGVGEGDVFPDDYDTGLTNAFIRPTTGYYFLGDGTVVSWEVALEAHEAVGYVITEFGLYSEDEQLFARKIRTPGIISDSSLSLVGAWTIWLMECKKTTFFSYVTFDFNITDPVFDRTNEVSITPAIEHSITSSGNAERVLAAQADIIADITSSSNTPREFVSTADIESDINDLTIDFTNVERRFSVAVNYFYQMGNTTLIFNWGDFMSQADIESDITDPSIFNLGDFVTQADILWDINSARAAFLAINDAGDVLLINDTDDKLEISPDPTDV